MAYSDSGLKIHFHPWESGYQNELMLTRNTHTQLDDQKKKNLIQKDPRKRNRNKHIYTYKVCCGDV